MTCNTDLKFGPYRNRVRCRRRGLVIREVIVLTILPILLMHLLLPAVLWVREARRRAQCSSNLKQQALAMHSFHDTFRRLPAGASEAIGASNAPNPESDGKYLYAWGAPILPFIEQNSAFDALGTASPNDLEGNFRQSLSTLQTSIKTFRCPADVSAPALNIGRSFELSSGENVPIALSNYVAVIGSGELTTGFGPNYVNGMFYVDSSVKFESITDGTSNTLMLGERAWGRKNWATYRSRAAVVYGVRSVRETSFSGLADAMAAGCYRINFEAVDQPDGLGESYVRRGYSSNHSGGAFFALADGSTRFVGQSIHGGFDPTTQRTQTPEVDSVWEQILSRNDGQELLEDF